jgi:hypothetical protein
MTSTFFESSIASRVQDRAQLSQLLDTLTGEDAVLFDLTFQARFAKRMLDVIQREGPDTQGFSRMQQSFREAVERVREIVRVQGERGFSSAGDYLSLDAKSFQNLLRLVHDLSVVKDWMLQQEESE